MSEILKSSTRAIFPSKEDYACVCVIRTSGKSIIQVFMQGISENSAKELAKGGYALVKRNGKQTPIVDKDCYAYGKIDLEDEDDIALIRSFKWGNDRVVGHPYPVDYDFESNTGALCCPPLQKPFVAWGETFDNLKLFKFAYAKIGKPKNVVVYGVSKTKSSEFSTAEGW